MKKLSNLIPESAKILTGKQMSNISGGNNQDEIPSYFLAVFRCYCKYGANPPYVNQWTETYPTFNDALKDVDKMCIEGAGTCERIG